MKLKLKKTYRKIYEWARDGSRPGGEFDWFAVDRLGNVAAFCTAGFGHVPDAIFDDGWDAYFGLAAFMEQLDATPLHAGGFEPFLNRGLTVYDFDSESTGAYIREGVASSPLCVGRIPVIPRNLVESVRFEGEFTDLETLFAEDHWACR